MSQIDRDAGRAVPVFTGRGAQKRITGGTDWWFYPLLMAVAAALIAVSLGGGVFVQAARPQTARQDGNVLIYGPHALARGTDVDATHVRYVVRDLGVNARAVRFAVRPNTPPPVAGDNGVALLLVPAQTAALAGRPVRAEITVRRFSISAAGAVALRLDEAPWTLAPLPLQSGVLTIDLPAPTRAPERLGIRLISEETDMNYGAEFSRIVLQPVP